MKMENNENSAPAAASGELIEIGAILNVSHIITLWNLLNVILNLRTINFSWKYVHLKNKSHFPPAITGIQGIACQAFELVM